jgi:hypothetical protein
MVANFDTSWSSRTPDGVECDLSAGGWWRGEEDRGPVSDLVAKRILNTLPGFGMNSSLLMRFLLACRPEF